MKLTILERPTPQTAREFKDRLKKELENLKGELTANLTLEELSANGWAQISVSGADSEIVAQLITNTFGQAVTIPREIEILGVYAAVITGANEKGLTFDVGLGAKNFDFTIPTGTLLAQLADGKHVPLRHVIDCYGLYAGMKVSVRTARDDNGTVQWWLSDDYLYSLSGWVRSGLDRIIAYECYKQEAEEAIVNAHLTRDVLATESVTLTVQSIVCKFGTDAIGLLPKLGRILRKQKLSPFQPHKIEETCRPW